MELVAHAQGVDDRSFVVGRVEVEEVDLERQRGKRTRKRGSQAFFIFILSRDSSSCFLTLSGLRVLLPKGLAEKDEEEGEDQLV